jgi:hypothetical protein
VVWQKDGISGDLEAIRIDEAGVVLPIGDLVTGPAVSFGAVVLGKTAGWSLLWMEIDEEGRALRRGLVDPSGTLHPERRLLLTPPALQAADLAAAAAGESVHAAWRQPLPGDEDDLFRTTFAAADTAGVPDPVPLTLVEAVVSVPLPPESRPLRVFPNPFRSGVRIEGPGATPTEAEVLDLRGRRLRRLSASDRRYWDGRSDAGAPVPPGVYWIRVAGGSSVRVVRIP